MNRRYLILELMLLSVFCEEVNAQVKKQCPILEMMINARGEQKS